MWVFCEAENKSIAYGSNLYIVNEWEQFDRMIISTDGTSFLHDNYDKLTDIKLKYIRFHLIAFFPNYRVRSKRNSIMSATMKKYIIGI